MFANVLYLIFVNITHYSDLHFGIEPLAFVMTAFLFAGFFFLLELLAIRTIGKTSPLILFRASEKGEREPKGNVLLAALGVFSLGMGYYLSLSSKAEGLAVIYRFFIAVLFVIAGTYLFYISFMTWYLKARRKNKRYFYTPEHFITTSQMIFRMKQHATGLANITLLAVMAFVTIATTTSLYTGMSSMTGVLYPKETSITYKVSYRSQGVAAYQQSVLSHFPEKANDNLSSKQVWSMMVGAILSSIQKPLPIQTLAKWPLPTSSPKMISGNWGMTCQSWLPIKLPLCVRVKCRRLRSLFWAIKPLRM
ncbi:hypothetical protein NLY77_04870 [Streptococcus suis]|uniref:hypothetical protein n=1 Tax=Streptococcus suis TaxID=1307 RepID=UPI0020C1B7CA|nr:hypothetical protein [Streptococcus suis]UTI51779.1 hypothetical protein NLY77_04870 [Streptococcus suis]